MTSDEPTPPFAQPAPPQPVYGQPAAQPGSPYPPAGPYASPGYGGPGGPGYAPASATYPAPIYSYASWGRRVLGALVDYLLRLVCGIPVVVGYVLILADSTITTDSDGVTRFHFHSGAGPFLLIAVGALLSIAELIWNVCIRQGRTGCTVGKSLVGIKLVKEDTGQPIGAGMAFVRQLCHFLDGLCYVGYLWPIWDDKKQTFADKVLSTVVVNQPAR